MIMVEAEWPSLPSRAPTADGTSPVVIFVYVPDVDRTVERASACGAKVLVPLQNQFWGDRMAWLMDPSDMSGRWRRASRKRRRRSARRDGRRRWRKGRPNERHFLLPQLGEIRFVHELPLVELCNGLVAVRSLGDLSA